jgi:dTDP-4-dehydrorhamnose 3,5-epimerase-like enzyme
MNKIQVTQPTFLINLDNPTEVSYVPMEGNWKSIIVQTYQHGFPEIQDNEILYVYKENRGYIKKQQVMISDDFQIGPDGAYEAVEYSIPIYENGVKTEWSVDGIVGDEKYQQLLRMSPDGKLPIMINTTIKQ